MGLFGSLFKKRNPTYPTPTCIVCGHKGWTFPEEDRGKVAIYAVAEELMDTLLSTCPTCGVFLHERCGDTVQELTGETYRRCPICGKRL